MLINTLPIFKKEVIMSKEEKGKEASGVEPGRAEPGRLGKVRQPLLMP